MANEERPFLLSELIAGHQRGFTDMECANTLRLIVGEAERLGRAGKMTLTFTVAPEKTHDGAAVKIAIDTAYVMPKEPATPTLYFVADDKRPTKRSPLQPLTRVDGGDEIFAREDLD